jgi:pilus assembly protein CpaC
MRHMRSNKPIMIGSHRLARVTAVAGVVFGSIVLAPLSSIWGQVLESYEKEPKVVETPNHRKPTRENEVQVEEADPQALVAQEAAELQLLAGASMIIVMPKQLERVSVANPEVANVQIVPPNQVHVNGKAPGITTLIIWVDGKRRYYDIVVKLNLSLVEQAMKEISPNDDITVKAVQNSIALSGSVSDPSLIARAPDVAKAFLPEKTTVINLLRLSEPHQIMLKVEIAEINRTALRELGLDFLNLGNTFALGVFGGTTAGVLNTIIDPEKGVLFDPRTSLFFGKGNTMTFLRALEQKGLAKSLARPTLIAASGADAAFLVGGEFPYPVVQGGSGGAGASATIQFKPFGVRLNFVPTLNDLGTINLKIEPEVSALDFSNAVTISGFNIPSLTTRRARTIVDLKPGQSLAIGGLIQTEDRKILTKFPILGDIPVLGALFRSTNFIRNETDLIIFVTPEIVKPFAAGQAPNLEQQMKTTWEEEKEIRQIPGR